MGEREPKLVAHVGMTTVLGVASEAPSVLCAKDGRLDEKTFTLQAFPDRGKLYLVGVRAFYDQEETADVTFDLLHPRTGESLLRNGPVPGVALNPEHPECRRHFPGVDAEALVVPIYRANVEGGIEPMYCSKEQPLLIVATGTVFVHLAIWGAERYSVTNPCGRFHHHGEFEGPFPYASVPGLLPKRKGDP